MTRMKVKKTFQQLTKSNYQIIFQQDRKIMGRVFLDTQTERKVYTYFRPPPPNHKASLG